jgi:hypothetical protein
MAKRHVVGRVRARYLPKAVLAARKYKASFGLPMKTQQRFYAQMTKLAGLVATDNGMDPDDAFIQITREADRLGPIAITPGKDY